MPHSTRYMNSGTSSRLYAGKMEPSGRTSMEKFPDMILDDAHIYSSPATANVKGYAINGLPPREPWQSRKESLRWSQDQTYNGDKGQSRQKSLSDAFRMIRTRKGSVSANVHEISDALKAPVSPKLVVLCIVWYMSSALTNTSSKAILNAFPKPATLTIIQFAFVSSFCLLFSWLSSIFPAMKDNIPALRHGIRYPTRDVIITTLPLAGFQIGGHLLSATATGRIPVSLVHTIKGLSPLFTVFAYRVIFDIRYPIATYLSLIPLTLGVMLACSAEFKGNVFGITYAFLATLIFVTQNIFSKKLFNEAAIAEAAGSPPTRKLDKLNLLCYSSGFAFILTAPIWIYSEGFGLVKDFYDDGSLDLEIHPTSFDHGRLALEFLFNGTFHFGQNIIAFVLLSMVSPVTYSVASLIKRVFIVVAAIIWFRNPTTKIQGLGIALTFLGLYLYDRTSGRSKADRKAKMMDIQEEPLLPTSNGTSQPIMPTIEPPPRQQNGYALNTGSEDKRSDDAGRGGRVRGSSNATWLPPGTKQEDTWRLAEFSNNTNGSHVSAN
ncbi:triose-phosphate transporter family-domain-containing protein [Calycina marina]|uniref:Triose-phosphate transporter family-domain-containing protein n=1 Tax=Calycina marina TaxID=1763456 RepID=A0A9P7YYP8_9HELO|nr:triose-phosphate transporter family-domain-containing protein [Calycina marina]